MDRLNDIFYKSLWPSLLVILMIHAIDQLSVELNWQLFDYLISFIFLTLASFVYFYKTADTSDPRKKITTLALAVIILLVSWSVLI